MANNQHDESRIQIAIKRLLARAVTSTNTGEGPANEKYPTNIQVSASTVFAETLPDLPLRGNDETGGV